MVGSQWFCLIAFVFFSGFLPNEQCTSSRNSEALPFLFLIAGNTMSNGWKLPTYNWLLSLGVKGQAMVVVWWQTNCLDQAPLFFPQNNPEAWS